MYFVYTPLGTAFHLQTFVFSGGPQSVEEAVCSAPCWYLNTLWELSEFYIHAYQIVCQCLSSRLVPSCFSKDFSGPKIWKDPIGPDTLSYDNYLGFFFFFSFYLKSSVYDKGFVGTEAVPCPLLPFSPPWRQPLCSWLAVAVTSLFTKSICK